MRYIAPVFLLLFLFNTSSAQYWDWAKDTEGIRAQKIASDGINSIYVHGSYGGTVSIGGHSISSAPDGIYIAKYDTSGNALWAKDISYANRMSFANDIAVDGSGNVYVTGVVMMSGGGNISNYVIKFDSAGNKLWESVQAIGLGYLGASTYYYWHQHYHLAVDKNGDAYITGIVTQTFTYGGNTYAFRPGAAASILKINATGGTEWLTVYSMDINGFTPEDIIVDHDGNLIICGHALSGSDAGEYIFDNFKLPIESKNQQSAIQGATLYVVKLHKSEGKVLWGKTSLSIPPQGVDDPSPSCAWAIAVDSKNDIYLNGFFNNEITIDGVSLFEHNPGNVNGANYLAKLSENGDVKWLKQTYDQKNAAFGWPYKIVINSSDDVFICNTYTSLKNAGYKQYTVSRLDTSGNILWNESVTCGVGFLPDIGGLCTDATHNVYVSGTLEGGGYSNPDIKLGVHTVMVPQTEQHKEYVAKLAPHKTNSVQNVETEHSFEVYPNPANDHINISIDKPLNTEYTISVTDISGKELINNMGVLQGTTTVNTGRLSTGTYVIQLKQGGTVKAAKSFIKN